LKATRRITHDGIKEWTQINTKIYVENPTREKPRAAMGKESTMMMGKYRIDIKAICSE